MGETGVAEITLAHRSEFVVPSMVCSLWGDNVKGTSSRTAAFYILSFRLWDRFVGAFPKLIN